MGTNGYSQKKRPFSKLGNMWKHITVLSFWGLRDWLGNPQPNI